MTTTSPIAASFAPLTYVSGTGLVLFDTGNFPAYDNFESNTYVWNGSNNWTLTVPEGDYINPPVRNFTATAYDVGSSSLYLFGGLGSPGLEAFNDVWSYNASTKAWTSIIANYNNVGPTGRCHPMMVSMSVGAVLLGGISPGYQYIYQDLWILTSGAWTQCTIAGSLPANQNQPSVRYNASFASNAAGGAGTQSVLFGGQNSGALLQDIWTLTISGITATWTQCSVVGGVQPSCRAGAAFCWCQQGGYYLLMGGNDSSGNTLSDVWTLTIAGSAATWTQIISNTTSNASGPQHITGAALASDGSTQTILWGGENSKLNLNTTWAWQTASKTWVQQ